MSVVPDALTCEHVWKIYDGTPAVADVSVGIESGTVHAIVGANGAGKSTLLGMLSGRTAPTRGSVKVFGTALPGGSPRAARAAGVSSVYQELTIVPHLTACANVFLGAERTQSGFIDERGMRRRYEELSEMFMLDVPPDTLARDLSVARCQLLEIMRAVQLDTRVLLFDEPTAALSFREREFLLGLMRRLREHHDHTIVFVSHNLDEILAVSDTVTVMRNARHIATNPGSESTKASLVEAMTGHAPVAAQSDRHRVEGSVVLELRNARPRGGAHGISLALRRHEVLGIAGLVGSGRSRFLRCVAGADSFADGEMEISGRRVPFPRTPLQALKHGIAMLPEDRKNQGLVLGMSGPDNITLPYLDAVSSMGLVSSREQLSVAAQLMHAFTLNRPVGQYPVSELSGGGQQKVAFARALFRRPSVLVVDEPTRGVDVAAKAELLRAIREFARDGGAAIVTSSEIDEVLDVSDRVIVFSLGRIVGEFDMHTSSPTVRDVLDLGFGVIA